MAQTGLPTVQEEVPLTGRLAEFRTALREEIEAARRNEESSAVSLINGRRIAQVGGGYQYIFDVENVLNLPGDTPGYLRVPGYPSQEVTVISVDGMKITLSVPDDLGAFIPDARLQSNLADLMRKLIERIEGMTNRANPVGDRILEPARVTGSPIATEYKELNREQSLALSSSLGRDVTFIWGPPGTGKTRTIGAIAHCLYQQGRSVLLVSHTNAAVDEALLRIADVIDPSELSNGRVLRVGDPLVARLKDEKYKEVLLKTHTDRRSAELVQRRDICTAELESSTKEVISLSRTIDVAEWTHEAGQDIENMSRELCEVQTSEGLLEETRNQQRLHLVPAAQWLVAAEAARLAIRRLSKMVELDKRIADASVIVTGTNTNLANANDALSHAEAVLAETTSVGWLTRRWRGLPVPDKQQAEVATRRDQQELLQGKLAVAKQAVAEMHATKGKLEAEDAVFRNKYQTTPDEILRLAEQHSRCLTEIQTRIDQILCDSTVRRASLEDLLSHRLTVLKDWGLAITWPTEAVDMLEVITEAYTRAKAGVANVDLPALRARQNELNDEIRILQVELQGIEESLKRIEELVISAAIVVATTLTRAYLRQSIQSRRFDTVILDEASMAPIPALWVAASIATANAVVVGDFKQLAPIVISECDLPQKWLGRDIFEVAGVNGPRGVTGLRVDLLEQHRMHPEISAIPNALVYGHELRDAARMSTNSEDDLNEWYCAEWGHDHPVLLVDTGPLGAWVTSVSRGGRASRLNFLSATICVDIAEQLLKSDRVKVRDGERHRILIACPYRPHAQLLRLLIRDQGLDRDVLAGTAHSFQGSEADVVLLDLVNDEPHWRVAMFMPEHDEDVRRLLNVALTRARRRLVIVGDFRYIQQQGKRTFVGKDLVPFLLERYPSVDAREVVPTGLAAREARAQNKVTGGALEANADRVVVTQERFYPILTSDLAKACTRVVIYSAFMTQDRLGQLGPQLRAATERGIHVFVVTKAWSDRGKRELANYQMLEKALEDWGVVVVHKQRMHEKLVFVDDDILWLGSLNTLSFRNTQEIMERRRSPDVVKDFSKTIKLDDLLREYSNGTPRCPICESEVVASEGRDEPFFWTCVQPGCYSRSVDQPPLTNGLIVCANCTGPVEFGDWGGKPVWRCQNNPRHHQRIARTHLRLPRMRELIPKGELRNLEKRFGVELVRATSGKGNGAQMNFFDPTDE